MEVWIPYCSCTIRRFVILHGEGGALLPVPWAAAYMASGFRMEEWKRMRSGDRPGLQNRRSLSCDSGGGFDSHSLPPLFNNLQTSKSLANQFGFDGAIWTRLEWA